MENVSLIICTYNEAKTIADVVKTVCIYNKQSEVIVVDDGSVDNTETILNQLPKELHFRYERLKENKGKSWAMVHGVEISTKDIILFFDADVSNIKKEHFTNLVKPILDSEADMVLGQPSETLIDYRINPFKALTGERALLKKDIIPILNDIREIRFGVETFINLYYQAQGKKIKYILLDGLKHPTKYAKANPLNATKEFVKEGKEIATVLVNNQDLIFQRIRLILDRADSIAISNLNAIQKEINDRLLAIKNRLNL